MKYKVKNEEKLGIVELICKNRNVDIEKLEEFLCPTSANISSPFIYKNMSEGVKLLLDSIKNNLKIGILIDSDCDGYCSAAMLMNYIREILKYDNLIFFLHSEKEHGLTEKIMKDIFIAKPNLLIVPDAGSNDLNQLKTLKENNIKTIVIDHHEAKEYSEDALIINNQMNKEGNKTLSGGGMVLKFLEAIDFNLGLNASEKYRDLAAVSLVGDCMLMTEGETRFYVQYGLRNLNNNLLVELQKVDSNRNFEMVSYDFAPTINAFIRVGTLEEKLDLFFALLEIKSNRKITIRGQGTFELDLGEYIAKLSNRIKSRQTSEIKKALESANVTIQHKDIPFSICILDENANKNLTGLIGNRLVELYNKPALVFKNYNGIYRGSARTTDTYPNFKDYISSLNIFDYAEGHQGAFGVGIKKVNLEKTTIELRDKTLGEESDCYLVDKAYVDKVSAYEIMAVDELKNQWSNGFEKPIFYIKLTNLDEKNIDIIGQKKDTIRIKHNYITYVKFKCCEEEIEKVKNNIINEVELIGTFHLNEWNENLYPQVQIEKIEFTKATQKEAEMNAFNFDFKNISNLTW